MLLPNVLGSATAKGDGLFLPERPLGSIGAKVALASQLGLIDGPVERALNVLRKLRNAFVHSAESASLSDAAHSSRLEEVYADARSNPLWTPLETVLAAQPPSANGVLEPALRNYILLITILVAFLEATAQQLRPMQPPVVMGFSGVSRNNGANQQYSQIGASTASRACGYMVRVLRWVRHGHALPSCSHPARTGKA